LRDGQSVVEEPPAAEVGVSGGEVAALARSCGDGEHVAAMRSALPAVNVRLRVVELRRLKGVRVWAERILDALTH